MIVVDTAIIAYLYLPTQYTDGVEKILIKDTVGAAPVLWRSELRNVLANYLRKNIIDFETASNIQTEAEQLLASNEFDVDSIFVLMLDNESGCSAYDCEFVSLAKSLGCKLISSDKKLKTAFPVVYWMQTRMLQKNFSTPT